MILTQTIVRDPPWSRHFRRIAPVLVILGIMLLAMVPGVIVHLSHQPDEAPGADPTKRLVADQRR